ncbi:MAG: TolC family protein [Bacteroidetes bacterium]|nr:TolC family protein [Bacteroidota bacterium]
MKTFSKTFLLCLALVNFAFAQRVLTLKDAISIALQKSFNVKSADLALLSSEKSLEAIKLGLMTSVNMVFNVPSYSRTLSNQFNPLTGTQQFFNYGFTTYEGQLYFTQPIVLTNGTFTLTGDLWKRSQFSSEQQIPVDYYSNVSLSFQQPLFTFNTLKANLTRAEINLEKAKRNYSIASNDIVYNVTAGFYQLYQAKENVEIAREKVKQTAASYKTAQNKYKAGVNAEVDALQLEVDLASSRNDLLSAENALSESLNDFKILIGLSLSDSIDVSAQLDYKPVNIDLNEAIDYALASRKELANAKADIALSRLSVDEISSQGNVTAEISANYGINKDANLFQEIYHDFAGSRSVTFTVKVPVLDWGENRREVESAEASLKEYELIYENNKEQIKKEIIEIVNRINFAKARVEALSKSVAVAQKSYDISIQRFQAGTITSSDLQQMQLRLTDAKTNSLNALIDYKLALADLKRKTLHDFEGQ